MKYKRLLILVTCLFFVTVTVICFFTLYRVADISLTAVTVDGSPQKVKEITENYLKDYKDKNLVFLDTSKIEEDIENKSYYIDVEEVTKNMPNQLYVKIKERKEVFAVKVDSDFYVLDDEFYCVNKKSQNANNVDGNSNILLTFNVSDYSIDALKVGKAFVLNDKASQEYLTSVVDFFENIRSDINEIEVKVKESGFYNRQLILKMKEGVVITIDNAPLKTNDKLSFAYDYYLSLSNKSVGEYTVSVSAGTGDFIIS